MLFLWPKYIDHLTINPNGFFPRLDLGCVSLGFVRFFNCFGWKHLYEDLWYKKMSWKQIFCHFSSLLSLSLSLSLMDWNQTKSIQVSIILIFVLVLIILIYQAHGTPPLAFSKQGILSTKRMHRELQKEGTITNTIVHTACAGDCCTCFNHSWHQIYRPSEGPACF